MPGLTFLYISIDTMSSAFFPMTERFRDEWGHEVVPVQLRILIKELGDHVGYVAAPLGWPDLYSVTKEGRLPHHVRRDYFGVPCDCYCPDSGWSWWFPYAN